MEPFYIHQRASNLEKKFIEFLEKQKNVKWWFKNKDHGLEFFLFLMKKKVKSNYFLLIL